MTIAEMFSDFLSNLAIQNTEIISSRYGELTGALNKRFRETESKTANSLRVGSFGRNTGIDGISDLDMLYIMPKTSWDDYKDGGQYKLLRHAKDAILTRYPTTDVRVDRLVVTVTYSDFHVEVQPVFEQEDGSFKYPDTKGNGAWKITKPREEMEAIAKLDSEKNANLRRLCKMARSWRNKHGVEMGGLLIDTLAYNFLRGTADYDTKSFLYFDLLSRDFFANLAELADQEFYAAPGSGQRVRVKKKFKKKAKKSHDLCLAAIEAENSENVCKKWRKIYGRAFPADAERVVENASARVSRAWRNTEEFIEDLFPVDIRFTVEIDCEVSQKGFRTWRLTEMLAKSIPLLSSKSLIFRIVANTVPPPFDLKWKVLNRGDEVEFPANSWRSRACVIVHARSDQEEYEAGESEVDRTSCSSEIFGRISS